MNWHSKEGIVFMIQVDHLSGEQLGFALNRFYEAGASNVQMISSITKKNRPSWVVLIDCREEYRKAVEAMIPMELGVGGWHMFKTEHHYLYSDSVERRIRFCMEGDEDGPVWTVKGKLFENGNLRPEHDSVVMLQEELYHCYGEYLCYTVLYHIIMECLEREDTENCLVYSLPLKRLL